MEETSEEERIRRNSRIKSTAVVKYSAVEAPACFAKLSFNTDLKQPPQNWLSPTVVCLQQPLSSGFSSFRMAHTFPDCVGEVDVVSDAENIKKLLKIPYSKAPVSLIVHRVGNTILLDELDVHKHLLRAAEWDWRWLRTFFFEHVLKSLSCKDKGLYQKGMTSRGALQQRSLVSKFLYHSLAETPTRTEDAPKPPVVPSPQTLDGAWASLPEAQPVLPDTKSNHEFVRNVVWTFEDIQMLIGTDMPIFGGSTHPCISLRLRDAKKPISVLTGIDYWLDNLMCNVPEVVMCYHLDGIVQKYELIKTEDLPHLAGSKFSPKLIHDVAQNILSFLKSNATKAGHTYWLFKGKDDDAVKLYDLSSLCGDDIDNPFTVPVAMLLYRVARNMKQQGSAQLGCIRTLLENCLSLLDITKHPQIATSAHFMLADLYIPADTAPLTPELPQDEVDENYEDEIVGDVDLTGETSVEIQHLAIPAEPPRYSGAPPPLCGSISERCRLALRHCAQGLESLRMLARQHEDLNMAAPNQPIPMPEKDTPLRATVPRQEDWTSHLRSLIHQKATLSLAVLAHESLSQEKYGAVLKQTKAVILYGDDAVRASAYGDAGDACSFIVQHWTDVGRFREEMNATDFEVDAVLEQLRLDASQDCATWELEGLENMQETLRSAVDAYKQARALVDPGDMAAALDRRLGNAHNELGALLMSLASANQSSEMFDVLANESLENLEAGAKEFERAGDTVNLALLLSNTGRLMRLRAHVSHASPLTQQERVFLNKAVSHYQRALSVLESREKTSVSVWDSVAWDLSTTLFNLATILQDCPWPGHDQDRQEREASEALQKALQTCDMDTPGARLPLYQFRAATLHHRLASLHHRVYRTQSESTKRKFALQLCRLHYEKSAEIFLIIEEHTELLKVQLERVALAEFIAEQSSGTGAKRKAILGALELALSSELKGLEDSDESLRLLKLLEQRVQALCLFLVKLAKGLDEYKKMYALALHRASQDETVQALSIRLSKQFQQIRSLMSK